MQHCFARTAAPAIACARGCGCVCKWKRVRVQAMVLGRRRSTQSHGTSTKAFLNSGHGTHRACFLYLQFQPALLASSDHTGFLCFCRLTADLGDVTLSRSRPLISLHMKQRTRTRSMHWTRSVKTFTGMGVVVSLQTLSEEVDALHVRCP